jgi:hypothetical protein
MTAYNLKDELTLIASTHPSRAAWWAIDAAAAGLAGSREQIKMTGQIDDLSGHFDCMPSMTVAV